MQRSLQQLAGGTPYKRLAGVVGVSAFLTSEEKDQRAQAELALSNAVAIEESDVVRNAILSSFDHIDPKIVTRAELENTISVLVEASQNLMRTGLWFSRGPMYSRSLKMLVQKRAQRTSASL